MKINLCTAGPDIIEGYHNVVPVGLQAQTGVYYFPYDNFNAICGDGEADEIRTNDALTMVEAKFHGPLIQYWAKKLSLSGRMTFVAYDVNFLARAFHLGQIGTFNLNSFLVHGKSSCVTMNDLIEYCERLNLKILEKRYDGLKLVLVVGR